MGEVIRNRRRFNRRIAVVYPERKKRRLSGSSLSFRKEQWVSKGRNRWAIILAGGDGTRLLSLTRAIAGDDRPKQFCPILGDETLLDQTRRRVSLAVTPAQTMFSFRESHKPFYEELVMDVPGANLVVQPENLGTTPAMLYSLLKLSIIEPEAAVGFFPSDHYFTDGQTFMGHVDSAFAALKARPEMMILLGIEPDQPEVEYGWIEPARSTMNQFPRGIRPVKRFWEKPSARAAQTFMDRGFLWNSFVMVGRVETFLQTIRRAVPNLYASFEAVKPTFGTDLEYDSVRDLYARINPSNFSRDVLSMRANDLSVMPVKNVGWSDWGDPSRVLSTLARIGLQAESARTSA